METILAIGSTRQGKSRLVKSMITAPSTINLPCMVYDPQNEYGDTYTTLINGERQEVPGPGLPANNLSLPRSRYSVFRGMGMEGFKVFIEAASRKKGTNIIVEEASNYFEGRTSTDIMELLVGRFHSRNNYIFVFHGLNLVPPRLLRQTNKIMLFKTLDTLKEVKARFDNEKLIEAFIRQSQKPDGAPPEIIELIGIS